MWRGEESAGKIDRKSKKDRVKETCKGKYFSPIGMLKLLLIFNALISHCRFFYYCSKSPYQKNAAPPPLGPTDLSNSEKKLLLTMCCCDLSRKKSFGEFIVSIQWVNSLTCQGLDSRY